LQPPIRAPRFFFLAALRLFSALVAPSKRPNAQTPPTSRRAVKIGERQNAADFPTRRSTQAPPFSNVSG
jgi:hypothetical protein